MARLAAQERLLFYPTEIEALKLIAPRLTFDTGYEGQKPTFLDPSAGDGRALEYLDPDGLTEKYAIELDKARAESLGGKADHVLHGPRELARYNGKFDLIFDNPPYDHGLGSGRQEAAHFKLDMFALAPGGVFIGVWPLDTVKKHIGLLAHHLDGIFLYRMLEEVDRFSQVIILGQKKRSSYSYYGPGARARLEDMVEGKTPMPVLGADEWPDLAAWKVRPNFRAIKPHTFTMLSGSDNLAGLLDTALTDGITTEPAYEILLGKNAKDIGRVRPVLPMRPGHVGLAIAAGVVNGTETIIDGRPHLIKGSSQKVIKTKTDESSYEGDEETPAHTVTEITEDEAPAHTVTTLCLETGQVEYFQTHDTDRAQNDRFSHFLETHKDALSEAAHAACPPRVDLSDERCQKMRSVLASRIHAPGKLPGEKAEGLLPAQTDRAIAMAARILDGESAIILSGEMGTGKTVISLAALGLIMHYQNRKNWKHVVMCPAATVHKWKRESERVLSEFGVKAHIIGESIKRADGRGKIRKCSKPVLDVQAAMAEENPSVLIIGFETAKNGARWQHAPMTTGKLFEFRAEEGKRAQQVIKKYLPILACPDCGRGLRSESGVYLNDIRALTKNQKYICPKCKSPFWSQVPFSYGGRVAIADYLNRHYSGQFSLTIDESHNTKGADTDIGYASQDLISGARWAIAMTGTQVNGYTSSVYNVCYRLFRDLRDLYSYGESEKNRFVARHGLLRTVTKITEYKTYHSKYGYERIQKRSPKEIPGMTPDLITWLLERTVFLHLIDVSEKLPPYTEYQLPIAPDDMIEDGLAQLADMKQTAGQLAVKGKMSLIANWLSAAIGWPDLPVTETIKYLDSEDSVNEWVIEGHDSEEPPITPKIEALAEVITAEVEAGRGVGVFYSQVNRRNWMSKTKEVLESLGYYAEIFTRDMAAPAKREGWYRAFLKRSYMYAPSQAPILLTNGNLFKEGLDLLELPTIIEAGIDFNLTNVRQRDRRSWRLTQSNPVKVIFMYYKGSHQEAALSLMAQKFRASNQYEGESISGLAALADSDLYDSFMNLMIRGKLSSDISMPVYQIETGDHFYMLPRLAKEVSMNGQKVMAQQPTLFPKE